MLEEAKKLKNKFTWFDIFHETYESTPIVFKNNRFYSVSKNDTSGYGVRVNKDGKSGLSFCNRKGDIVETSKKAESLSHFGQEDHFLLPQRNSFKKMQNEENAFPSVDEQINLANKAIDKINLVYNDAITDVHISFGRASRHLVNSNDVDYFDASNWFSAGVYVTRVNEKGVRTEIGDSLYDVNVVNIDRLVDRVLLFHKYAEKICTIKPGSVPVIFTPSAFSSLISIFLSQMIAVNHYKKISPFTSKLGEKVFSSSLSIVDNPLLPHSVNSFDFDDEGLLAKEKKIVNKGVLENIISDLRYANLLGIEPSGNSSRSYASMPSVSFSNVIIEAGNKSYKEILKNVKRGILVDQMLGLGQSNTITGEFSCNLDMAFYFEDGEILGRIKDCMIADNIYNLLARDMEFSNEIETCGNIYTPYTFFDKINLSL